MAQVATETASFTFVIESRSPHETKSWGRRLASVLEGGELLGLIGDLGAGHTVFIKGLASGPNQLLGSEQPSNRIQRRRRSSRLDYYQAEESFRLSLRGSSGNRSRPPRGAGLHIKFRP